MTSPAAAPRAVRVCDGCGQADDLPHHQVARPTENGLEVESLHMACCAARGCPDGSCNRILTGSAPGV